MYTVVVLKNKTHTTAQSSLKTSVKKKGINKGSKSKTNSNTKDNSNNNNGKKKKISKNDSSIKISSTDDTSNSENNSESNDDTNDKIKLETDSSEYNPDVDENIDINRYSEGDTDIDIVTNDESKQRSKRKKGRATTKTGKTIGTSKINKNKNKNANKNKNKNTNKNKNKNKSKNKGKTNKIGSGNKLGFYKHYDSEGQIIAATDDVISSYSRSFQVRTYGLAVLLPGHERINCTESEFDKSNDFVAESYCKYKSTALIRKDLAVKRNGKTKRSQDGDPAPKRRKLNNGKAASGTEDKREIDSAVEDEIEDESEDDNEHENENDNTNDNDNTIIEKDNDDSGYENESDESDSDVEDKKLKKQKVHRNKSLKEALKRQRRNKHNSLPISPSTAPSRKVNKKSSKNSRTNTKQQTIDLCANDNTFETAETAKTRTKRKNKSKKNRKNKNLATKSLRAGKAAAQATKQTLKKGNKISKTSATAQTNASKQGEYQCSFKRCSIKHVSPANPKIANFKYYPQRKSFQLPTAIRGTQTDSKMKFLIIIQKKDLQNVAPLISKVKTVRGGNLTIQIEKTHKTAGEYGDQTPITQEVIDSLKNIKNVNTVRIHCTIFEIAQILELMYIYIPGKRIQLKGYWSHLKKYGKGSFDWYWKQVRDTPNSQLFTLHYQLLMMQSHYQLDDVFIQTIAARPNYGTLLSPPEGRLLYDFVVPCGMMQAAFGINSERCGMEDKRGFDVSAHYGAFKFSVYVFLDILSVFIILVLIYIFIVFFLWFFDILFFFL